MEFTTFHTFFACGKRNHAIDVDWLTFHTHALGKVRNSVSLRPKIPMFSTASSPLHDARIMLFLPSYSSSLTHLRCCFEKFPYPFLPVFPTKRDHQHNSLNSFDCEKCFVLSVSTPLILYSPCIGTTLRNSITFWNTELVPALLANQPRISLVYLLIRHYFHAKKRFMTFLS